MGILEQQQGESHTLNHITLFLSCLFYLLLAYFSCYKILKPQKISLIFISVLFIFYLVAMFPPNFGTKDDKVGTWHHMDAPRVTI